MLREKSQSFLRSGYRYFFWRPLVLRSKTSGRQFKYLRSCGYIAIFINSIALVGDELSTQIAAYVWPAVVLEGRDLRRSPKIPIIGTPVGR